MDNLGRHKNKALHRPERAAGATLPCPPKYAPDINPIEPLFAKPKHGVAAR
jgi:hypothetical protein